MKRYKIEATDNTREKYDPIDGCTFTSLHDLHNTAMDLVEAPQFVYTEDEILEDLEIDGRSLVVAESNASYNGLEYWAVAINE